MLPTVPQGGRPGMFLVTFVHVRPPSRVSCTCPSFVPAQMSPFSRRHSAMAITVNAYSTPILSGVRPPELRCQLWPPSRVTWTYWLPTYTVFGSWGEIASGIVQLKRYFSSAGGQPPVDSG